MDSVDLLEQVGGLWRYRKTAREELLQLEYDRNRVIFGSTETFASSEDFRQRLSIQYTIPEDFWSELHQHHNGFVGCADVYDSEQKLKLHATWFRFLVKQVVTSNNTGRYSYEWYEMGFFTTWTSSGAQILFCFDTPTIFADRVQAFFLSPTRSAELPDVYSLHVTVIDEIVKLFDRSIWSLRDVIKMTEVNRPGAVQQEPEFPLLHDYARHTIHSSETLDVAIDTVTSLLDQHERFSHMGLPCTEISSIDMRNTRQRLRFQIQLMRGLRARSKANESRLRNEIDLAFNMIAQRDSRTAVSLNSAAQRNSAAMRTIAVLTLTFLPATFVSTIFSMTFFNFSPGSDARPEAWVVSGKIWIYWSISLPLTVITILSWLAWQRMSGSA